MPSVRTAIYVHEPSTVTIQATNPRDANVELCRYNRTANRPAIGTHALEPGIYQVVSSHPVEVHSRGATTHVVAFDKDIWPDPKAHVIALEPGANAASIREFFTVAKDLSIDVRGAGRDGQPNQ